MTKTTSTLTLFGKDLNTLLKKAGKFNLREYADECGVSYKYISQLRTMPDRRPGGLYADLLKPFTKLKVLGLEESHQLSLSHRGRPLSLNECKKLFPDVPEQQLVGSIKQAFELKDRREIQAPLNRLNIVGIPKPVVPGILYRRVFVGRETELGVLQSTFDNAVSGQGSLVMVAGEPGIGKTALCGQLTAYVSSRGGKSLVGHCYSERSLSLPYLAFVEVLRSYIQAHDVSELRKELGSGFADLSRIIPEIRDKLKVHPRSKGDPDEERYRLMEAVTHFLGSIATIQPLLIILEDLHNADNGTLEMLTHVSRNLAGMRLLLVGTYRDIEIDRSHPLSATLSELRRLLTFRRVMLRGLNANEVSRMLSSITGQEVPWGLAEAIHRQTEGNPLFVQEVARYLVEEGVISPRGEVRQEYKDIPFEMKIPDGLRDVIGRRLSGLSEGCNHILSTAAVIGRDFRLEVLQKVAGINDEETFKALEEARKVAVIEEKVGIGAAVNYRFAHAFFQQTLYEEIIAPRRVRLHQQVARALEEVYKTRLEEHAAELAEHFSHSSDDNDLKKAISYGQIAAQRAVDVYAYGEAVRLLDQALNLQEILNPEDKAKRCDLLLDLCSALFDVPDTRRILASLAPVAFALAENIGDSSRAVRACIMALNSIGREQLGPGSATPQYAEWVGQLDRYAKPDTIERACADYHLGMVKFWTGHMRSGQSLLIQAHDLARRLADQETLLLIGPQLLLYRSAVQHTKERIQLAEELWTCRRVGRIDIIARIPEMVGDTFLSLGQRQRAEEAFSELRNLAAHTGNIHLGIVSLAMDSILSVMDGRLEAAIDMAERIRAIGKEAGMAGSANLYAYPSQHVARFYLGTSPEPFADPNLRRILPMQQEEDASVILEQLVIRRPGFGDNNDETIAWQDVLYLEEAVLTCNRKAAELLLNRLGNASLCTSGIWHLTCVARQLGRACALLERYEEARKYYDEAIKVCTEMRFRPELALSRLQLAELLLEHCPKEKKEAVEHLDFCIKEFRDMKMQPSLERALRYKEILKA